MIVSNSIMAMNTSPESMKWKKILEKRSFEDPMKWKPAIINKYDRQ